MVVVAYVLITVATGSEKKVCELFSKMKEIIEVSELYGEYDIIIKVELSELPELDTFLTDKIRAIKEVKLTSTMIVAYEHKREDK